MNPGAEKSRIHCCIIKLVRTILTTLLLLLILFSNANIAKAITIPSDTIYLYENGKRITNSSWMHDVYDYAPSCKRGSCYIQQGHNPTFYKTQETNVLNYDEWIDNWYLSRPGCEKFSTKAHEVRKALEEWRNSPEHASIQDRVNKAATKAEREAIWESSEPLRDKFMEKKFDFYNNPECKKIDYDEHEMYLNDLKNNASYSIAVNIPPSKDFDTSRTYRLDVEDGKLSEIPEAFSLYYLINTHFPFIPTLVIIILIILSITIIRKRKLSRRPKK